MQLLAQPEVHPDNLDGAVTGEETGIADAWRYLGAPVWEPDGPLFVGNIVETKINGRVTAGTPLTEVSAGRVTASDLSGPARAPAERGDGGWRWTSEPLLGRTGLVP